jgi:mitochondrial enoyl-[acyl-carrier protein] reductase / trans-2-enoyl-CoA reductase
VVTEQEEYFKNIKDLTGGAPVRLALNCIGGNSAMSLIKCLDQGGVMVTFGGMTAEKVRFPTRFLIFKDIRLHGFWWDQRIHSYPREQIQKIFDEVFTLIMEKTWSLPVEKTYHLSAWKEALAHASQPRFGKVLFKQA